MLGMRIRPANDAVNAAIREAQAMGPTDILTQIAFGLNSVLRFLLLPAFLLIAPVTIILGLLVTATFGLLLVPLSALWLPFLGALLGTSWLWTRVPFARPLLLAPGPLIALIGYAYVSLCPDMGEKYQKAVKLGVCDSWPYSFQVYRVLARQLGDATSQPGP